MNRQVHPMTNFDFLLSDPGFTAFAEAAIAAEKNSSYGSGSRCAALPQSHGIGC